MKSKRLVFSLIGAACIGGCALPWSGSGEPSTITPALASDDIQAACEKYAAPGCITACKKTGRCFTEDPSLISAVTCNGAYVSFERGWTSTGCNLSEIVAESEEDDALASARKRLFVTHNSWTGDLASAARTTDGITGADKLCTQAAAGAELGGKWKAFLSTLSRDGADRISDVDGGWYDVRRSSFVFANRSSFARGPHSYNSFLDESGASANNIVWTGDASSTCADWTSNSGIGATKINDFESAYSQYCSGSASLLCVEQ